MIGKLTGEPGASVLRYPPFAAPDVPVQNPPIGEFLDELPSIADFLAGPQENYPSIDDFAPDDRDDEGWAFTDWQSFDWSSLGSIARGIESGAAEADWSGTEWAPDDAGAHDETEVSADDWGSNESSAHEVAEALNDIAERIRSGELPIDKFHGEPPEVAMAAALAALLRMRG